MKNKILITGTGRNGTSILMQLFTHLGMDTGFTPEEADRRLQNRANAGLEITDLTQDIRIHKAPHFALTIEEDITNHIVDHVIIPIRKLEHSAKSRARRGRKLGGMIGGSRTYEQQEIFNAKILYNLIEILEKNGIHYTIIHFPTFIYDIELLYEKLRWLFEEYDITKSTYIEKMNNIVDTNKLHFI
ncbi:unnamed protein product [marine sediment metagenome]|uniref:Uncharacterized protein n=1 Tax=marine sediment metagenome TaxID=412755 RepID=X1KCV7_9ZZZZ